MSENPIRDLVKYGEESMPVIEKVLRGKYQAGYDARMQGKPKMIAHSRRQGAWRKGWDDADQVLKKRKRRKHEQAEN